MIPLQQAPEIVEVVADQFYSAAEELLAAGVEPGSPEFFVLVLAALLLLLPR